MIEYYYPPNYTNYRTLLHVIPYNHCVLHFLPIFAVSFLIHTLFFLPPCGSLSTFTFCLQQCSPRMSACVPLVLLQSTCSSIACRLFCQLSLEPLQKLVLFGAISTRLNTFGAASAIHLCVLVVRLCPPILVTQLAHWEIVSV